MKIWGKLTSALLAVTVLLANGTAYPAAPVSAADDVYFQSLSGLPFANGDPFKGVDLSSVISLENSGVKFYDRNGSEQDVFVTLADAGVNTVRVRIWNDPYETGTGANYGGGICDVNVAVQIAERCAAAGLKLLVDFHYSDFWADPGKQEAPKAWRNYSISQKADAIYQFTLETLNKIRDAGGDVAMVQVGNETTTGMCGVMLSDYNWSDEGWASLSSLFNAGARAVREFDPDTLVSLHFTNPENASNMTYLAKMLSQYQVDYDVFATSYYPYWHGTLSNLTSVLTAVSQTYGKQVLVAETSWVRTLDENDGFQNTIGSAENMGDYVSYDISVAGQTAYLHDLFTAVAAVPEGKGIGVFYWEPAWLPVSSTGRAANQPLWEQYGSGWANKSAGEYDSSARDYYGGSCVDNESLFSNDGKPLDSLYVFGTVHGTSTGEDAELSSNLLQNPGFEADGGWSDAPSGWTLRSTAGGHFDVRAEDARSGGYALHWYSESSFTGSTASTSVKVTESGAYRCTVHLQADEASSYTLTAASSGGQRKTVSGNGNGWAAWQAPQVELDVHAGETVTLTLTVSGGAGSYGSADDCAVQKVTHTVPDISVKLEEHEITLRRDDRHQLRADRSDLTYESDRPDIVQISSKGEIVAVGEGTAVITVYVGGHRADEVVVTVAGQRETAGDLNADGQADRKDAELLMLFLTQGKANGMQNADLSGDGMINAVDLTLLKQIITQETKNSPPALGSCFCFGKCFYSILFPPSSLSSLLSIV